MGKTEKVRVVRLLMQRIGIQTLTLVTAKPTRSSNDLKAVEFFTSPNFRATEPPMLPNIPVVLSAAAFTASLVF